MLPILCLVQQAPTLLRRAITILISVFRGRFTLTVPLEVQTSHLARKAITAPPELVLVSSVQQGTIVRPTLRPPWTALQHTTAGLDHLLLRNAG